MAKKNFKENNPALIFINAPVDLEQAPNIEQVQEVHHTQGTQGKKGKKLQRINMAFSDANLEYLQLISRIEGVSMTEYTNRIMDADRALRIDILEEAKKLLKGAKKI